MRQLTDKAIERFNDYLASERGFLHAVVLTAAWTVAVVLHIDEHGFLFLYVATAVSFVTQFNLALIGRRSGRKVDQALATIDNVVDNVYASTQLLVQMAENETHLQEALAAQSQAIVAALTELRTAANPSR